MYDFKEGVPTMYELKKLNLKQSEKYMTYKCNEYGKHYKKFSRLFL